MGKYFVRGHGVRTKHSKVHAPCEAVGFCSRPYGFFRPCSRKCVRPSYGTIIDGFAKKVPAGPYWSYDKHYYQKQHIPCMLSVCVLQFSSHR